MIDYLCGGEIFDAVRWAGMGKYQVVFLVQVVKASPFILEGQDIWKVLVFEHEN
jgi:ABC-type proline/glycine betaine transport system permease subunit